MPRSTTLAALLTIAVGALLGACLHPRAEVHDYCVDHPDECAPCMHDDECRFAGNPCTDAVFCLREGTPVAFVEIGCSKQLERRWPDDDECVCIDQVCQSEP